MTSTGCNEPPHFCPYCVPPDGPGGFEIDGDEGDVEFPTPAGAIFEVLLDYLSPESADEASYDICWYLSYLMRKVPRPEWATVNTICNEAKSNTLFWNPGASESESFY